MLASGLGSIFLGSLAALYQKRLKRLFAYSTISHTGFMLLAILCSSVDGVYSLTFYIITYSSLTVLLFSFLIFPGFSTKNFPVYLSN